MNVFNLNPFTHKDVSWSLCSSRLFDNIVAKEEIALMFIILNFYIKRFSIFFSRPFLSCLLRIWCMRECVNLCVNYLLLSVVQQCSTLQSSCYPRRIKTPIKTKSCVRPNLQTAKTPTILCKVSQNYI